MLVTSSEARLHLQSSLVASGIAAAVINTAFPYLLREGVQGDCQGNLPPGMERDGFPMWTGCGHTRCRVSLCPGGKWCCCHNKPRGRLMHCKLRLLRGTFTQTQSSVVNVPDTKVLLSFPSKVRDAGIRACLSGSCVLVTQSLPISEGIEMVIPHPTTARSTRGMLSLVEGCSSPPWAAHQYLWVAKRVTYASLVRGSRAEGVPSAGRQ